jgi:hypothetical protein
LVLLAAECPVASIQRMKPKHRTCLAALLILLAAASVFAQSDDNEPSLGDLARSLRKSKAAATTQNVIDNENLPRVMEEVESHKQKGSMVYSFDRLGKSFQVSSPDVTCSLSFTAPATSLLSSPYAPQEVPQKELAKLDGPAAIDGSALLVSVYNGSTWNIKEITVGITLVRESESKTAGHRQARVIPAAETTPLTQQKRSDATFLYHLKGSAAPGTTTVFQENLANAPSPGQDWHWAIVQAKGVPPERPIAPSSPTP